MLSTRLFQYRYVPAKATEPSSSATKVMVVFHGLGDSYDGYGWLPSSLNLPGLAYFFVNAPDEYYGGFSWYDYMGAQASGILRSRKLVLDLLEELAEQGVSSENLLLFGFSQGCLIALDVGLRVQTKLAGICGVSGYLAFQEEYPDNLSPVALDQHFLLTHGTRDPVVPFSVSKRQYAFLKTLGVKLEFKSYDKDHTILPEELEDIKAWVKERLKANPG